MGPMGEVSGVRVNGVDGANVGGLCARSEATIFLLFNNKKQILMLQKTNSTILEFHFCIGAQEDPATTKLVPLVLGS